MQGNTRVPVVEELAALVERAERACKTTAQLVRDFNFIVVWYQSRPRSRLRADPILDETGEQEQTLAEYAQKPVFMDSEPGPRAVPE
jgi:hypothetical protein